MDPSGPWKVTLRPIAMGQKWVPFLCRSHLGNAQPWQLCSSPHSWLSPGMEGAPAVHSSCFSRASPWLSGKQRTAHPHRLRVPHIALVVRTCFLLLFHCQTVWRRRPKLPCRHSLRRCRLWGCHPIRLGAWSRSHCSWIWPAGRWRSLGNRSSHTQSGSWKPQLLWSPARWRGLDGPRSLVHSQDCQTYYRRALAMVSSWIYNTWL